MLDERPTKSKALKKFHWLLSLCLRCDGFRYAPSLVLSNLPGVVVVIHCNVCQGSFPKSGWLLEMIN